jgi:hypothetical protein
MAVNLKSSQDTDLSTQASAWVKRNRARLQALALVAALIAPFGLYWSLQWGWDGVAAIFFFVTVASLIVVIVAG